MRVENFFPLDSEMMEGTPDFTRLAAGEKLLWWAILSELNLRQGKFYRADLEWAVTLRLSVSKVRQARRKFQRLSWLKVTPGRKAEGRNLATTYSSAKWVNTREGTFWAPMHRFAFEQMLRGLRAGRFTHREIVLYVFLCYCWSKFLRDGNRDIFIPKGTLRRISNLENLSQLFGNLHGRFQFKGGAHLFSYFESHHRFTIAKLNEFADPSKDKNNRKVMQQTQAELRDAIVRAKAIADAKARDKEPVGAVNAGGAFQKTKGVSNTL